ncbi:hypothetical protein F2Q70_00003934 [Brassica cretica]|uniref:Uncharacterized protein n=1 Tax=Brassica cretica TaxID=69181 RepID=A0A8S9G3N5_BRACR|nr:hypothetical protein F2Q68_00021096 [Brassica cretica]KAF2570428.1 hypothetical protein F2Q70_00003934 [Brassica cretica]
MFFRRNIGVVSTDPKTELRKLRTKMNSSSHSSSGDSSANEVIAPTKEFEVEEEAKDAYYKALCGSPPPSQDIPIPKRPVRSPNAPFTPSMASPDYLTTLRDFYQIPSGVVFRIPSGNESATNPRVGIISLSFISRFDVSRLSVAVFDLCVLWPCEAM